MNPRPVFNHEFEEADRIEQISVKHLANMMSDPKWVQEAIDNSVDTLGTLLLGLFNANHAERNAILFEIGRRVEDGAEKYLEMRSMEMAQNGEYP